MPNKYRNKGDIIARTVSKFAIIAVIGLFFLVAIRGGVAWRLHKTPVCTTQPAQISAEIPRTRM